jgi:hypothetical protein
MIPSAVVQCIVVKFISNKNVRPAEILVICGAQFDDEMLSRIQVYDWSKSFEEGWTKVENIQRLHLLWRKL